MIFFINSQTFSCIHTFTEFLIKHNSLSIPYSKHNTVFTLKFNSVKYYGNQIYPLTRVRPVSHDDGSILEWVYHLLLQFDTLTLETADFDCLIL